MKKMFVLAIVVLAISLVFTACKTDEHGNPVQSKGGHLNLINDTAAPQDFSIYFDGSYVRVNDGQDTIQPDQTIAAYSDKDTSYAVYNATGTNADYLLTSGQLTGGITVDIKFSEHLPTTP